MQLIEASMVLTNDSIIECLVHHDKTRNWLQCSKGINWDLPVGLQI